MRRAARVDANHRLIVAALRTAGCSVLSLAAVGKGCPDILVARAGINYLLEIKKKTARGAISAGAARSLEGQEAWAERWRAPVHFVSTPEEALDAVGLVA